jgi:hypothetical protein
VHRGSSRSAACMTQGPPRRRHEETLDFSSQPCKRPIGNPPATAGGRPSSAIPGGTPADSPTIRSPGARSLGRPIAARDTANNRAGSLFMYRRCDSKDFHSLCSPHNSAGTPALDAADAPPQRPDCYAKCSRKASNEIPKTPFNLSPRKCRY